MAIVDNLDPAAVRSLVSDWWHVLIVGGGALYLTTKVVYRRFFHPLANVPGPFLPAVTRLYAWYYNVPLEGKFFKEIERLHEIYGPIVRITPDEVHLSDPAHYDYVYGTKSGFYKDHRFYGALGIDVATFGSVHNEDHRRRRAALNPFFSRKKVLELEDIVHDKADKLCRILQNNKDADKPTNIDAAFRAISVDVVTDYAFGESWDQLGSPDLGAWFSDMVRGSSGMFFTLQAFPTLKFLHSLPPSVAKRMSPAVADFIGCQVRTLKHVTDVQSQVDQNIKPTRQTIFHQLMDPSAAEGHIVPRTNDVADEAFAICTAAADTTGNAMGMACYKTITNPEIYAKVKKELRDAFPDADAELKFTDLEKLPYLTGIIKEGQRLSYGVISRLPRVVPSGGSTLEGYFLPAGTVVSMSSWMMHHDPEAFPNPEVFDPDRWTDPSVFHERDKCLVPFSRGRRMCVGINLAWCELYVTLGTLFRRFENLATFDVGDEDMVYQEYFSAFHPPEKRKFRVVVGAE